MIDISRDSTLIICDACGWWYQGVGWDHLEAAKDALTQHNTDEHNDTRSIE